MKNIRVIMKQSFKNEVEQIKYQRGLIKYEIILNGNPKYLKNGEEIYILNHYMK